MNEFFKKKKMTKRGIRKTLLEYIFLRVSEGENKKEKKKKRKNMRKRSRMKHGKMSKERLGG